MIAPSSKFYGKTWVGFCLNTGKRFFLRGFTLKPIESAQVLLKIGTRDFQNSHLLERSACFMRQSVKILNVFDTVTLKQIFWKTKTVFKKLEYCSLVESNKIENASFPYKTDISEVNVKTNRMVTIKWTYQKERSFASNYFSFLKILFQFKNLL